MYDNDKDFETETMRMNHEDEALALMSMALDNLLSQEEELHLQVMLAADPQLAATWRDWQRMEGRLSQVVHAEPPLDFVQQFEVRLNQQELQQQRRRNLLFVAVALLIWGSMFGGALGLFAYAFNKQAIWGSEFIHTLTQIAATLSEWLSALQGIVMATASSPQTMGMLIGYCAAGAAIVLWWAHWLRQSTQMMETQ